MLHILGKIPYRVTVACSGGIDSMVLVHFLLKGRKKVDLAYFNHDTQHSKDAEQFIKQFAGKHKLNLVVGRVKNNRQKRESIEEFWRNERYSFLESLGSNHIFTAHHLDDVVETWVMSSLHGQSKLIPYSRNCKIYRPLLTTSKQQITDYAKHHSISYVDDPSNQSSKYMRNMVRNEMMSLVLKVNPGIHKTIKKKLLELNNNI